MASSTRFRLDKNYRRISNPPLGPISSPTPPEEIARICGYKLINDYKMTSAIKKRLTDYHWEKLKSKQGDEDNCGCPHDSKERCKYYRKQTCAHRKQCVICHQNCKNCMNNPFKKTRVSNPDGTVNELSGWAGDRDVTLFYDPMKGFGLKAHNRIAEGKYLFPYYGAVTDENVGPIPEDAKYYTMGFNTDLKLTVNPYEYGNAASVLNHSHEPNCEVGSFFYDGSVYLIIYAIRDIQVGEELTFDYNKEFDTIEELKPCNCGGRGCDGKIGTLKWRMQLQQSRNELRSEFRSRQLQLLNEHGRKPAPTEFAAVDWQTAEKYKCEPVFPDRLERTEENFIFKEGDPACFIGLDEGKTKLIVSCGWVVESHKNKQDQWFYVIKRCTDNAYGIYVPRFFVFHYHDEALFFIEYQYTARDKAAMKKWLKSSHLYEQKCLKMQNPICEDMELSFQVGELRKFQIVHRNNTAGATALGISVTICLPEDNAGPSRNAQIQDLPEEEHDFEEMEQQELNPVNTTSTTPSNEPGTSGMLQGTSSVHIRTVQPRDEEHDYASLASIDQVASPPQPLPKSSAPLSALPIDTMLPTNVPESPLDRSFVESVHFNESLGNEAIEEDGYPNVNAMSRGTQTVNEDLVHSPSNEEYDEDQESESFNPIPNYVYGHYTSVDKLRDEFGGWASTKKNIFHVAIECSVMSQGIVPRDQRVNIDIVFKAIKKRLKQHYVKSVPSERKYLTFQHYLVGIEEHHPTSIDLQWCSLCRPSQNCGYRSDLRLHYLEKHSLVAFSYSCLKCKKQYFLPSLWRDHLRTCDNDGIIEIRRGTFEFIDDLFADFVAKQAANFTELYIFPPGIASVSTGKSRDAKGERIIGAENKTFNIDPATGLPTNAPPGFQMRKLVFTMKGGDNSTLSSRLCGWENLRRFGATKRTPGTVVGRDENGKFMFLTQTTRAPGSDQEDDQNDLDSAPSGQTSNTNVGKRKTNKKKKKSSKAPAVDLKPHARLTPSRSACLPDATRKTSTKTTAFVSADLVSKAITAAIQAAIAAQEAQVQASSSNCSDANQSDSDQGDNDDKRGGGGGAVASSVTCTQTHTEQPPVLPEAKTISKRKANMFKVIEQPQEITNSSNVADNQLNCDTESHGNQQTTQQRQVLPNPPTQNQRRKGNPAKAGAAFKLPKPRTRTQSSSQTESEKVPSTEQPGPSEQSSEAETVAHHSHQPTTSYPSLSDMAERGNSAPSNNCAGDNQGEARHRLPAKNLKQTTLLSFVVVPPSSPQQEQQSQRTPPPVDRTRKDKASKKAGPTSRTNRACSPIQTVPQHAVTADVTGPRTSPVNNASMNSQRQPETQSRANAKRRRSSSEPPSPTTRQTEMSRICRDMPQPPRPMSSNDNRTSGTSSSQKSSPKKGEKKETDKQAVAVVKKPLKKKTKMQETRPATENCDVNDRARRQPTSKKSKQPEKDNDKNAGTSSALTRAYSPSPRVRVEVCEPTQGTSRGQNVISVTVRSPVSQREESPCSGDSTDTVIVPTRRQAGPTNQPEAEGNQTQQPQASSTTNTRVTKKTKRKQKKDK